MNPTELRAALSALGLTQAGAARVLGVQPRSVERWAAGEPVVPEWARRVLLAALAHPELIGWLTASRPA